MNGKKINFPSVAKDLKKFEINNKSVHHVLFAPNTNDELKQGTF